MQSKSIGVFLGVLSGQTDRLVLIKQDWGMETPFFDSFRAALAPSIASAKELLTLLRGLFFSTAQTPQAIFSVQAGYASCLEVRKTEKYFRHSARSSLSPNPAG